MQIQAAAAMAQATTIQQMLLVKKTVDAEQVQQLQLLASVPVDSTDEPVAPDNDTTSEKDSGHFLDQKA